MWQPATAKTMRERDYTTMTKFKDFGAGKLDENAQPISFKLHGEDFNCKSQMQGRNLLKLVSSANADDPVESAKAVNNFFDMVLLKEDLVRFNTLLEDDEKIVTVETLAEIVSWLMEQYTNRPEEQPEV